MKRYDSFKTFLKHNLTQDVEVSGFRGTLIDAHNLEDREQMLKILDMSRKSEIPWWVHYDGPRVAWNLFQSNYSTLNIVNRVVPSSIIPLVQEIERNQLSLNMGKQNIYCSSCFRMRSENAILKLRLKELGVSSEESEGEGADVSDCSNGEPAIAPLLKNWFSDNYHTLGSGRGYNRTKFRSELQEFLTSKMGFRAKLGSSHELWTWFVREVINDTSAQYRGFRVWKK